MTVRADSGFSLLEVLVALVLLGVFSLAAWRGLDSVLTTERHALGEMARWRGLNQAFTRIQVDLGTLLPGSLGASQPGFVAETREDGSWRLAFDRQVAEDAGGVERVEYRYAAGLLTRTVAAARPASLLTGLRSARPGFLDANGAWLAAWRPETPGMAPAALQLDLAWDNGLGLRRVFAP